MAKTEKQTNKQTRGSSYLAAARMGMFGFAFGAVTGCARAHNLLVFAATSWFTSSQGGLPTTISQRSRSEIGRRRRSWRSSDGSGASPSTDCCAVRFSGLVHVAVWQTGSRVGARRWDAAERMPPQEHRVTSPLPRRNEKSGMRFQTCTNRTTINALKKNNIR